MIPEIKIDSARAIARFSPAGIPTSVMNSLRTMLPDLGRDVGALVNQKLNTGLKSRRRVAIREQMRESTNSTISVRVFAEWTGDPARKMVPQVLESGAKPHAIVAVNAPYLVFFWERMNRWVKTKQVWHPGFPGIHYMRDTLSEMRGEITSRLRTAIIDGAREP